MLLLEEFPAKKTAVKLTNFLLSQNVPAVIKQHASMFEVWIERNEHLEQAQSILQEFIADPNADRFKVKLVDNRRRKARELQASYKRNFTRRYRYNYLTITLIAISVILFAASYLMRTNFSGLVLTWSFRSTLQQPWRLITPMFIHLNPFHLIFNCYWLYYLGGLVEQKEKTWFFIVFILLAALATNLTQQLLMVYWPRVAYDSGNGGLSGIVYALFAYLWLSAKFNPMSGYWIRQDVVFWLVGWFVISFLGYFGGVGHYSYFGGLLTGALFAYIKSMKGFRYKR
jgi:GlpG protein